MHFGIFPFRVFDKALGIRACLCGITKNGRTIADKQEVNSGGNYDQKTRYGAGDYAGSVFQVELTGTRDIDVTRRLVSSGVQVEGDHQSTAVLRSLDVRSSIMERNVGVVERSGEVVVDRDSVSLDSDSIKSTGALGNSGGLGGSTVASLKLGSSPSCW